jgi:exopolyphosphatase/guanosine-5'-triphosphate,3'-diphosphate pyrophosphatase
MPAETTPVHIAAIDIGSNAIRLVLGEMTGHRDITLLKKVREPVRLGKDVFATGEISKKTAERAVETFKKFRGILKEADVHHVRAVATSALRETRNRDWFVSYVQAETGIKIEVIDGLEEARLIYTAVASRVDLHDKNALLIDIGGGSVELTISVKGRIKGVQTFKLGAVRLLQILEERDLKEKHLKNLLVELMAPVKTFVQSATKGVPIDVCVGTGGNFECLGKLRVALLNRNSIFSMTYHELSQLIEHLGSMSVKERIQYLRLRPDRADVVVPAALVIHAIMGFIPVEMLSIPYVGLRDGILADLGSKIR